MSAPTKKEIKAYLDRVEALSSPCEEIPGATMLNLFAPAPGDDPRVQIDTKRGTCTLYYVYPYEIDLDEINTPADLLSWVSHLCEKNWVTTAMLSEIIDRIGKAKKINTRLP